MEEIRKCSPRNIKEWEEYSEVIEEIKEEINRLQS